MRLISYEVFHSKFIHPSAGAMSKALALYDTKVEGPPTFDCEACNKSKAKTSPFPEQPDKATKVPQCVHSDLAGPIKELHKGYKYICTFTGKYFHFVVVFLFKKKVEAFQCFKDYLVYAKNKHNGKSLATLMINNGSR
eukprot:Ihof_evm10s240 gene=Ihof_evmTU10s240